MGACHPTIVIVIVLRKIALMGTQNECNDLTLDIMCLLKWLIQYFDIQVLPCTRLWLSFLLSKPFKLSTFRFIAMFHASKVDKWQHICLPYHFIREFQWAQHQTLCLSPDFVLQCLLVFHFYSCLKGMFECSHFIYSMLLHSHSENMGRKLNNSSLWMPQIEYHEQ